jgi:long-chain acyl-CoA synthetase
VLTLLVGFTCNCPERPQTVQRDLRELGPTIAIAPPRIWENMLTQLRVRAADSTPLKHRLFDFFRGLAERAEQLKGEGKRPSLISRLGLALGEVLVYGPVRDQLGLRRARWVYTGGAPLGPDTFRFFRAFGVNIKQVWGSTELAGLASLQPDGEADPDTVGRVIPGSEARIAEDGEVLIRSAAVFKGYYKQPDATRETMTGDGWLRSGDSGFVDRRGHLVIVDRAKDVGKLSDGTPFAPQFVENKLKFSPFIAEAVAFGDCRPFVAAIVAIDLTTVGNWAERRNLAYTSFQDLSAKPEVRRLIAEEIAEVNASLPAAARLRRFVLLNKEFDADDNEITRTRKIRRRFVAEKYAAIVDAFCSGKSEVEVTTEITYEDGRKATLTSTIAIEDILEPAAPAREPAYA